MARSLANKPNVEAPDSDYPYGRIKNKVGGVMGTPVTEEVYGDIHQFFEKLMEEAGLTHNELPDNDYSGFQFFEALNRLVNGEDWLSLPLINNWQENTPGSCKYKKIGNRVFLKGNLANSTVGSSNTICVLPDGYRPSHGLSFICGVSSGGTTSVPISIYPTTGSIPGTVSVGAFNGTIGATTTVILDSISFFVS